MVPTITARLRTMMKAMQEVVLPAVDPNHSIAQEQARLVLGSLNLILQQVDFAHAFEVVEAREMQSLGKELAALLKANSAPEAAKSIPEINAASAAIEDPLTPTTALQQINQALRGTIGSLIQAGESSGDAALIKQIAQRVLAYAESQLTRERSWIAATGFEPPGATLPIAEAIKITTTQ